MRGRKKRLGLAFKDEMLKVSRKSGHFKPVKANFGDWEDVFLPQFESTENLYKLSSWRLVVIASIFLIVFFGGFLRLFHLQIVLGNENRGLADSNRIRIKVIHAPRGVIYDRNGKVLAENNPGFRLKDKFLSRDEALSLEANKNPQLDALEIDAIRNYPLSPITSHVLGYVGQISEEELKEPQYKNYKIGDRIGRSGIEQIYEQVLKGKDGAEIIEVDAAGKRLQTLRKIDPIPGQNIYLSLDADLQRVAFNSLSDEIKKADSCCGATVSENPQTGEILSLVSWPPFDANAFTDPTRNKEVSGYFTDPNSPLLNRAISGTYPPGSTFKIASSLAGLYSKKITKDTKFEDTGIMHLGPYSFANWYFTSNGKTEGWVDLTKALQRSNDIYFYQVGQLVGEKILGEVAEKIGMGKKLGIDLPGEANGLIPTNEWKVKTIGQQWYPGDSLHMAIGQGFLLTTPLQILAETAFIAADGNLYQPHLATKITTADNFTLKQFHFDPLVKNLFSKEDLNLVKSGLNLVPKEGGTAWPFFNFSIPTAGKTGTAEFGDPKNKTHAWYTGYAPVDNPQIVATTLVEAGGEGSNVSAPVVKQIFTWYFNSDKAHIKSLDTSPVAADAAKALGE